MRRGSFVILAIVPCLLAAAGAASAVQPVPRVVGPRVEWSAGDLEGFRSEWIHLKLVEGIDVSVDGGVLQAGRATDLAKVEAALAAGGVREIAPTFRMDRRTARRWKAIGEARSGAVGPDLSLWFLLRVDGGREAAARLLNDLNACAVVEIAHPEPRVELAGGFASGAAPSREYGAPRVTPDFAPQQGYLYDPPVGLGASTAWTLPGGDGAGGRFIDVELAWTEDHEDFPFERLFHVGGAPQQPVPAYENHGTAVIGAVVGQTNGFGLDGMAHGLDGYGVVAVSTSTFPTVAQYFQEAVDHLAPGDVWLIELQMTPPGKSATPMEWLQVNYDVIWTSSWAREIVCVEAGANGAQDLDDPSWGGVFDRNARDSGAILVAAGTPGGFEAEWFTNWGSRMDLHAWGSSVVTAAYGDLYDGGTAQTRYTAVFNGTSAAAPLVAGSVLCLQGIARAGTGVPLAPSVVRSILASTGTPQQGQKAIGPRPDLAAASAEVLGMSFVPAPVSEARAQRILFEAAPNPFRESTTIRWRTPSTISAPRVAIFDGEGRSVRRFPADAGDALNSVGLFWDGCDDRGRPVGAGVYFIRVDAEGLRWSRSLRCVR